MGSKGIESFAIVTLAICVVLLTGALMHQRDRIDTLEKDIVYVEKEMMTIRNEMGLIHGYVEGMSERFKTLDSKIDE